MLWHCAHDEVALAQGGPHYRSIVFDSSLHAANVEFVTDPQQRPRRRRKDMQWRE